MRAIPAGTNAWHVAAAKSGADGRSVVICAGYDGAVTAVDLESGAQLWRYDTRAFPYDLAAADLDGDGTAEALAACADGALYVIYGKDGRPAWRFETREPLFQVAAARIGGTVRVLTGGVDQQLYVLDAAGRKLDERKMKGTLRHIRAGDLDGDGDDEVVVGFANGQLEALTGDRLSVLWRKRLRPTETPDRGAWRPYSLRLSDLDGDGRSELLLGASFFHKSGVRVLRPDGEILWEHAEAMEFRDGSRGSHSAVVACEADAARPGREVAALNGRRIFLFDARGKLLKTGVSPLGFANICVAAEAAESDQPAELVLASTPNGDDQVYRLRLQGNWSRAMRNMRRTGKMQDVAANLERIRRQVIAYKNRAERPNDGAKYVHVVSVGSPNTPNLLQSHFQVVDFYRRRFPYPNCAFGISITVMTNERLPGFTTEKRRPDRRRLTPQDACDLLRVCEKREIPFFVIAGHGCEPFLSVKTAASILKACPRMCLGFIATENEDHGERLERFLDGFWYPVLDLCKGAGKKGVLVQKGAWWATVPAMARFRRLVDGTYADVLVMSVEDTNTRSPELNLAGRLGLLASGQVSTISARTVPDEPTWHRLWQWECVMSGHPFLRRQMVQALCGATQFEHQLPQLELDGPRRFNVIGEESTELLIDMIGKGLLIPPRPAEMLGLSPLVVRMEEPAPEYLREAFQGFGFDSYRETPGEANWPLEGLASHRGMSPARDWYLGRILFEQRRHAHQFIPATPYGMAAVVPAFIPPSKLPWVRRDVVTDGTAIPDGAKRLTGKDAGRALKAAAQSVADDLPFQVSGYVFVQAQRMGPRRVRLTLIDSGYLDPDDRLVTIHVSAQTGVERFVDILSGEEIPVKVGEAHLTTPAGAFRILEADLSREFGDSSEESAPRSTARIEP